MKTRFQVSDRVEYEGKYYIVIRVIGYFYDLRSGDGHNVVNWINEDKLTPAPI